MKYPALILAGICTSAFAQTTVTIPVPSQFASAHTIFLASGSAPGYPNEKAIAAAVYTSVYQALAASGRYRLVPTPDGADLSMVVTLYGEMGHEEPTFLSLQIYDVKTHVLLWVLDEPIEAATLLKTLVKNAQASANLFAKDLNTLASGKLPGDVPPPKPETTKARLSQEGK